MKKGKLEYLDQDIAAGKTYYYQVRAYKASAQSYSSNTTSTKIPDDIAPATPKNLKVVDQTPSLLTVSWTKNTASDLKGYTINIYKGSEKLRAKELSTEFSTYSFFDLESGVIYKIELIATNTKDKTSAPAVTFGSTGFPEIIASILTSTSIIGGGVILILLTILVVRTIKHHKAKKNN